MRKYLPKVIAVPCHQLLSFKKNIGLYSNKLVLVCIYKSVQQLNELFTTVAIDHQSSIINKNGKALYVSLLVVGCMYR